MTPRSPRNTPDQLIAAEVWVFDLDNTLYPASSRLFDQVDWNITRFVAKFLNIDQVEARRLQKGYFRQHGTTMQGMMTLHGVDPKTYLEYVHNIDLAPISADPTLSAALERLPGRKLIFTNGSTAHAERITRHIGVDHHFSGCFDIIEAKYTPKPDPGIYAEFCRRFDIDPARAVMVEDMARNLIPAAELGMTTVWLSTDSDWARAGSDGNHIDHMIDELAPWLAELTGVA
ncbi:MAG: pyrimidine 5'-nucleotidase [Proteobacteria bacterium]|nr:pyrimidine 5'-nucleotidase [Pseudomonadota bacterium]